MNSDIEVLAERGRDVVTRESGMTADYSIESLAAVDHYLSTLTAGRPHDLLQIAAEVGCYFGEVLRRAFGATWTIPPRPEEDGEGPRPRTFTLTFTAAPLSVHPVGMAAEAIYEGEVEEHDASLHVPPALYAGLAQALESIGEVEEDYFYSLTGRLETLQHVLDVLVDVQNRAANDPRDTAPAPRRS